MPSTEGRNHSDAFVLSLGASLYPASLGGVGACMRRHQAQRDEPQCHGKQPQQALLAVDDKILSPELYFGMQ